MFSEKASNDLPAARMIGSSSESLEAYFHKGPLPVWIPVIISCSKVICHIETKVMLGLPVAQIRGSSTQIKVSQCKLLDLEKGLRGKVFFSGTIKEMIEYFEDDSAGENSSKIRFTSTRIPFECYSDIDYCIPPRLKPQNHVRLVELVSGIYTEESNLILKEKQDSSDFLQCELLDICVHDYIISKGRLPEQVSGQMTISVSFLLLQKQCIYLGR